MDPLARLDDLDSDLEPLPEESQAAIQAFEKRMDELVTHPTFGYRLSYRQLLEVQARLFGRFLAGELAEVPTFRTR
jgi:CRISPR-associated protein Cas1